MDAEEMRRPQRGAEQRPRSETQRQLQEMRPGEAWSHEAAARDYRAGGNQGEFTDSQLDLAGEEGYSTPT